MAYLTEKEKSILFAAINREENVCKEHGFDDLVQVCKRLTHLFSYNRFEKDIRNKAIDEFAERLRLNTSEYEIMDGFGVIEEIVDAVDVDKIWEIAEQMKGE